MSRLFLVSLCLFLSAAGAQARLNLILPTDNDAIFRGDGPGFYMHVDRTFRGERSTPWEAGQYGFFRDPVETPSGVVMKRFHEGVDIKPLRRDAKGVPLDEVRAVAGGAVVHVSHAAGASNYGRYVVIEHIWDGSKYYSLYAHLNVISTAIGASVKQGERIGILGFTGAGINKERAHLHFELNLMLNENFDLWYGPAFPTETNKHGLYNGMNLAGLDVAQLYLDLQKDPDLTIPQFVQRQPVRFRVVLPRPSRFTLLKLYPWLAGKPLETPSMEISFTGTGLPTRITPVARTVAKPELSWVKPSALPHTYLTRGLVSGSGATGRLAPGGLRLIRLLTAPE